ncbi:hypothetical protein PG996_006114 [Apiospora saccharicola]|uniref:Uncharacterized protein n=1 Tax=Apiospora saccharicola TaxID=335842 RepID=A0ABR1VND6_9PEZI
MGGSTRYNCWSITDNFLLSDHSRALVSYSFEAVDGQLQKIRDVGQQAFQFKHLNTVAAVVYDLLNHLGHLGQVIDAGRQAGSLLLGGLLHSPLPVIVLAGVGIEGILQLLLKGVIPNGAIVQGILRLEQIEKLLESLGDGDQLIALQHGSVLGLLALDPLRLELLAGHLELGGFGVTLVEVGYEIAHNLGDRGQIRGVVINLRQRLQELENVGDRHSDIHDASRGSGKVSR